MSLNEKDFEIAGWPLREFNSREIEKYLKEFQPEIFEVSKDQITKNASIKRLYKVLKDYKSKNNLKVSYAGTTDFEACSGLDFNEYKEYLKIQAEHAKFLQADFFRVLVGGEKGTEKDILERLEKFDSLLGDIRILIEFHGGWETNLDNIEKLVDETDFLFVVDFQNIVNSGITFEELNEILPVQRIAYFHARNMPKDYIEDKSILDERRKWQKYMKEKPVLWEPKELQKQDVKDDIEWT